MNYLYGDSTTSTLKSNFLEFLRDALDFCVFVLQADAKMNEGHAQIRALTEASDTETARLDRFIQSVTTAVQNGDKGEPDSPTAICGARLSALIADAHNASLEGIRQTLAEAIARIEAEEAASRDACVRALGTLLAPHQPPGAATVLRLGMLDSGHYEATLEAKSEPALAWKMEVGIPDESAWGSPLRVEQITRELEIRAPQLTGWISKEVKTRPQRIERHVVTRVVDDQASLRIELRSEPTSGIGFDFEVSLEKQSVTQALRVGPADDQSTGAFELHAEDAPLIVELATKLRASLAELEYGPNIAATFEEADFRSLPMFGTFVERLVAMMAPICQEISRRSLTPNELVLRRLLSNDRREEIFVAKATLREKLAALPPDARATFAPLGLEAVEKAKPSAAPSERPPVRSELPPSMPPPPPPKVTLKSKSTAPPASSGPASASVRTIKPPSAVPPQRNPPTSTPPVTAPATPRRQAIDTPIVDLVEEVSSDALMEAAPESSRADAQDGRPESEALIVALKKIMMLSKNGRAREAYEEYANLFSSSAFEACPSEDQRKALKLMVLAQNHPSEEEAVAAAHRAALPRIKALVDAASEPQPSDQEMLGVTYMVLGDEKSAEAAFKAGLEVERAKNPSSELAASLSRRVKEL